MGNFDKSGSLLTRDVDANGSTLETGGTGGDAYASGNINPFVLARLLGFNGATFDRLRTLAASGDGLGVLKVGGAPSAFYRPISALAIRDTVAHTAGVGALDGLRNVVIYLVTSLDQAVAIQLTEQSSGLGLNPTGLFTPVSVTGGNGGFISYNGAVEAGVFAVKPVLAGPFLASSTIMTVSLQCTVAPTTGTVSIAVAGSYN